MRLSSGSDCLSLDGAGAAGSSTTTQRSLTASHRGSIELPAADPVEIETLRAASRAVAGDAEGLNAVWNANRRWVAAILIAHKPRWADLDDLLQEVALSLVKKVSEVRDPAAIRPWLRTVALNVAHASARAGKVRGWVTGPQLAESDGEHIRSAGQPTSDPLIAEEKRVSILELAAQLPDGYREPLLLKAVDHLSYREIGRIMGLPETTVETRIARARKQLRELALARSLAD